MEEIQQQWKQFLQIPFPPSAHSTDLPLEMIDATIAGCISTFVQTGIIEKENLIKLQKSIETLESKFENIPEDAKAYFGELLKMGKGIDQAKKK